MAHTSSDPVDYLLDDNHNFRVTGVMMQYIEICKREVWFEYNNIEIDRENEHIVKGSIIDDNSYSYLDRNSIRIGPISPDMLDDGRIVEIKPSRSYEDSKKNQLYYYLWYLENKYSVSKDGVIAYPEQRERENVELTDEISDHIESLIEDIYNIVKDPEPPKLEKKKACDSCAYQDFCWTKGDTI